MKKLIILTLLFIMPFTVNADVKSEVIDKYEDVVYVLEDFGVECELETDYFYLVALDNSSNVLIHAQNFNNANNGNKFYYYDIETRVCNEVTEQDELINIATVLNSINWNFSYEVRDGKLYEIKQHSFLHDGYIEVGANNIDDEETYYDENHNEILDKEECRTGAKTCYIKKDVLILLPNEIDVDNGEYYEYDFNTKMLSFVNDNSICTSGISCFKEVEKRDYYFETPLVDIDMNNFNFAEDGLNDVDGIYDFFEFNGTKYILIYDNVKGDFIYKIDGTKVEFTLPEGITADDIDSSYINIYNNKYLSYTIYTNTKFYLFIYDDKFNLLYESSYDNSGQRYQEEYFEYLTNYENSLVLVKTYYSDGDQINDGQIRSLFTIKDYRLLEGANQTFKETDLTFKTNGDVNKVDKVFVDDKELELNKDYKKEKGSTIITLNKSYLNTLENGKHTIKITYNDAGYVETEFMSDKIPTPNTLDNITTYITLFVISIVGIVVAFVYYKKRFN